MNSTFGLQGPWLKLLRECPREKYRDSVELTHYVMMCVERSSILSDEKKQAFFAGKYNLHPESLTDPAGHEKIEAAIKRGDLDELTRLGKDPRYRRAIIRRLLGTDKERGRPEKTELQMASRDLDRVHEIWKRVYGRWRRDKDNGPQAVDIVARRYRVRPSELREYRRRRGHAG